METLLDRLFEVYSPSDFLGDGVSLMDTFGEAETEATAYWVLKFLVERGEGWAPFPVQKLEALYQKKFPQSRFCWNRLNTSLHTRFSIQEGPIPEEHDQCVDIVDGICTVRPTFVYRLLRPARSALRLQDRKARKK